MPRIAGITNGANNMAGAVESVINPGASESDPADGGSGAAMAPYPHEANGTPGGSWPGPVRQPAQNLGNV